MEQIKFIEDDSSKVLDKDFELLLLDSRPFYVVNKHPTRVIKAFRLFTGTWTTWQTLSAPIGFTCNYPDNKQCVAEQKWGLLSYLQVNVRYDIQIALLDNAGKWTNATATGISINGGDLYGWSFYQ